MCFIFCKNYVCFQLYSFQVAYETFHELDERIDFVATKVVHLGDQLESVNTPRARAVEAQKLMNHFAELMSPEPETGGVLNDPDMVILFNNEYYFKNFVHIKIFFNFCAVLLQTLHE